MPSLLDIRRRIRAVKSTQQITKAMKMISASKLRRAQERVIGARPFAQQMLRVLNSLASRVDPSTHPLLAQPEDVGVLPSLLIVITADKGLCGGFNTNIIKTAGQFITSAASRTEASGAIGARAKESRGGADRGAGAPGSSEVASGASGARAKESRGSAGRGAPGSSEVALGLVGRKGRDFFRRRGFSVHFEEIGIFQRVRFADAQRIARAVIDDFTSGHVESVYLVYNEFKSVMQQRVVVERLLPIPRLEGETRERLDRTEASGAIGPAAREAAKVTRVGAPGSSMAIPYIYEPSPEKIFSDLLPHHVEIQVYRALLESAAAEHAARMMAMDSATKNSAELIDDLTLYMNKVRQAAITREIIEVVSGAQAQ